MDEHPGDDFPSTRWSLVLDAGREAGSSLEDLAARYWRPIHATIRRRWRLSEADALDRTQDFFAWILESDFLARAEPTRGRFRAFVNVALERFLIDADRHRKRAKRGGGRRFVPLVAGPAEDGGGAVLPADPRSRQPEEILDEAWRAELVGQAVRSLESGYRCEGREVYYQVFADYFLAGESIDYAGLAERYDVKKSDVSNYLMHAKRRYREVLRQAVVETVESAEALEEELRWLVGP